MGKIRSALAFVFIFVGSTIFGSGDINSDSKPARGISNLYEMPSEMLRGTKVKREISLDEDVSDAWVFTNTGNNIPTDWLKVFINGNLAHSHLPNPRGHTLGAIYKAPISGFSKGKNEIVVENALRPFLIVIHLRSGREVEIKPDKEWTTSVKDEWRPVPVSVFTERQYMYTGKTRPYAGLIDIENPGRRMPVFIEGREIIQEVSIPLDFYGETAPVMRFTLRNCWTKANEPWAERTIGGERQNNRIVYRLRLNAEKQGAYDALYSFGPEKGEQRLAELIIAGKITQRKVAPAKIYDSLDKRLVDKIDCVAVDDPHTFRDDGSGTRLTASPLKAKDGMMKNISYRETGTSYLHSPGPTLSYMTWATKLDKINRLYMLEYDYPDNRNRTFTVGIVPEYPDGYGPEVTNICGGEFVLSNSIRTGRLLFYARTSDIEILVANKEAGQRAAVSELRLYEILNDRLPMADVSIPNPKLFMEINERGLNILTTNTYPGSDVWELGRNGKAQFSYDQLRRLYYAIENLICHIRFSGQNGFMPSSVMYDERFYPCWDSPDVKTDNLGLLAEMFSVNDLNMVLMSHYMLDMRLLTEDWRFTGQTMQRWLNTQGDISDESKDRFYLIDKNGRASIMYDASHPDVRRSFLDTLRSQLELYGDYNAFKGFNVYINGCMYRFGLGFVNNEYGYGDGTMRRFKEMMKVDLPEFNGGDRFLKRSEWIAKYADKEWVDFKCRIMTSLMSEAAALTVKTCKDARLFVAPIGCDITAFSSKNQDSWLDETETRYREVGFDITALKKIEGIVVTDYLGTGASRKPSVKMNLESFDWRVRSKKMLDYFDNKKNTAALLAGGYYENHVPWPEHPVYGKVDKHLIGNAAGAGEHYIHQLNLCLAGLGSSYIFDSYIESTLHIGHELEKARFAEVFAKIPYGNYEKLEGSNGFVTGRFSADAHETLYISNLRSFDTALEVVFEKKSDGSFRENAKLVDVMSGEEQCLRNDKLALSLKGYETRVFQCPKLKPGALVGIQPDQKQLDEYQRQSLCGDLQLEVTARLGDNGCVQLSIKNTGPALNRDFIRIIRHDGDLSLNNSYWEYGPLQPGEAQIITLPGNLTDMNQMLQGIVHSPNELFAFEWTQKKKALLSNHTDCDFVIDGNFEDWKNVPKTILPLHIRALAGELIKNPENRKQYPDIEINFASVWKNDGLYLYFEVPDNELIRNKLENPLWTGDGLNIYLDLDPVGDFSNKYYSEDDIEIIFAPADNKGRSDQFDLSNNMLKEVLKTHPELLKWKSALASQGYLLEIKIANEFLPDFKIYPGKALGFDVRLSDLDSADKAKGYTRYENNRNYSWHNDHPTEWNYQKTSHFGTLILASTQSNPGQFAKALAKEPVPDRKTLYFFDFEQEFGKDFLPGRTTIKRERRNDFYHGEYSLLVPSEKDEKGFWPFILLNKKIMVLPGENFEISFWVYSEKSSTGRLELAFKPEKQPKQSLSRIEEIIFKKGWNKYCFVGKGQPGEHSGALSVILRFLGEGVFFIDDFAVYVGNGEKEKQDPAGANRLNGITGKL